MLTEDVSGQASMGLWAHRLTYQK